MRNFLVINYMKLIFLAIFISRIASQQYENFITPEIVPTTAFPGLDTCPCASSMPKACPSCTRNPDENTFRQVVSLLECNCAPKPSCTPCPELYEAVQAMRMRRAEAESAASAALRSKAEEQLALYKMAQKLAEQMKKEEAKAMEAGKLMGEASSRAEQLRQQMQEATARARQIAESAIYDFSAIGTGNQVPFSPAGPGVFAAPINPSANFFSSLRPQQYNAREKFKNAERSYRFEEQNVAVIPRQPVFRPPATPSNSDYDRAKNQRVDYSTNYISPEIQRN